MPRITKTQRQRAWDAWVASEWEMTKGCDAARVTRRPKGRLTYPMVVIEQARPKVWSCEVHVWSKAMAQHSGFGPRDWGGWDYVTKKAAIDGAERAVAFSLGIVNGIAQEHPSEEAK